MSFSHENWHITDTDDALECKWGLMNFLCSDSLWLRLTETWQCAHSHAEINKKRSRFVGINVNNESKAKPKLTLMWENVFGLFLCFQVQPYLPYEYTCEGMLERVHAYIQNQVTIPSCDSNLLAFSQKSQEDEDLIDWTIDVFSDRLVVLGRQKKQLLSHQIFLHRAIKMISL